MIKKLAAADEFLHIGRQRGEIAQPAEDRDSRVGEDAERRRVRLARRRRRRIRESRER